jgi:hypothetical protein
MRCIQCQQQISVESKFCEFCGARQVPMIHFEMPSAPMPPTSIWQKHKKWWILGGAVTVLAAVFVLTFLMPYMSFDKSMKEAKYNQAFEKYRDLDQNQLYALTSLFIDRRLSVYYDTAYNDYVMESISYEDLQTLSNQLKELDAMKSMVVATEKDVKIVSESKKSYQNAKKLEVEKNYFGALDQYEAVSKKDEKNYPSAQEKIKVVSEEMLSFYRQEAREHEEDEEYLEAYRLIFDLQKYHKNNQDVEDDLQDYKQAYIDQVIDLAERDADNDLYITALASIYDGLAEFPDDPKLITKKSELETAQGLYEDEQERVRLAYEQERENPLRLTLSNDSYFDFENDYKAYFTLNNVSSFNISKVTVRFTLMDQNDNEMVSNTKTIFDLPAGQLKNDYCWVFSKQYYPRVRYTIESFEFEDEGYEGEYFD